MGTFHEDLCAFMVVSRAFLIRMRNVSDQSLREKTHFMCNNFFNLSAVVFHFPPSSWATLIRQPSRQEVIRYL